MHWALNCTFVKNATIKQALERERDHFIKTSPIPTPELDALSDALRKSYGGAEEITKQMRAMRDRMIADHPHADTPALIDLMDQGIAAACAVLTASGHENLVNVTVAGSLNEKIGEAAPGDKNSRDRFGDRINVSVDFLK